MTVTGGMESDRKNPKPKTFANFESLKDVEGLGLREYDSSKGDEGRRELFSCWRGIGSEHGIGTADLEGYSVSD